MLPEFVIPEIPFAFLALDTLNYVIFFSSTVGIVMIMLANRLWKLSNRTMPALQRSYHNQSTKPVGQKPCGLQERRNSFKLSFQMQGNSFMHVHDRLYLALYDATQAEIMANHELKLKFLVVPLSSTKTSEHDDDDCKFTPSSLVEIFKFDEMASAIERTNPTTKLVFCTGFQPIHQLKAAFFIGCHMIMSHGTNYEDTFVAFKHLHRIFDQFASDTGFIPSVQSCWRALYRAKSMNWIDFRNVFQTQHEDVQSICMDEFIHYSSVVNGEIYQVVPGQLIMFKAPRGDVPQGRDWLDLHGTRVFAPSFYADLFEYMNVSLVVRADSHHYNPDAFLDRCIDVEDLDPAASDGQQISLQTLDLFLTLVGNAPGQTAIHCDDNMGYAFTLVAAYLLRRRHFPDPLDAISWLHMVRPSTASVAVEHSLLHTMAAASPTAIRRSLSFHNEPPPPPAAAAAAAAAGLPSSDSSSSLASTISSAAAGPASPAGQGAMPRPEEMRCRSGSGPWPTQGGIVRLKGSKSSPNLAGMS